MDKNDFFITQKEACVLPKWNELPDIDLYMDQVITLMNKYFGGFASSGEAVITSSMINNYVKNEIIPPPVKKKYSRTHIFRLIIICIMKTILPINEIGKLIENLLKTNSEEEVLDYFSEQYKSEYLHTMEMLEKSIEKTMAEKGQENEDILLSYAIMHAAAIAGGNKFFAESALSRLNSVSEENEPENLKKEKKKAKEKESKTKEAEE